VTTVSKDNAHYLDKIFDTAEELGVDAMLLYYAWFTTEEIGCRHEAVMQEKLGVTPTAWRGYLWSFDEIDHKAVVESVKRIKSQKYSFPYLLIPDLTYEEIPQYYQEPANTFGYEKCVYPWLVTDIMPNGDVAPCRDYPDYVVGNIKEDSILDIFNNGRYRKFRQALKDMGGLFPICARCCGLMGW
jgi:radical SAM protein with 4Fe4S-binding SPASM domain